MAWNFGDDVQFGGGECHGARYLTHFCLAVEAGFYSHMIVCLPVDPATCVRFSAGTGKIFSLYDILKAFPIRYTHIKHQNSSSSYLKVMGNVKNSDSGGNFSITHWTHLIGPPYFLKDTVKAV